MTTTWYVIRAEPTRDAQVAYDLTQQGYQVVLSWTFQRVPAGKNGKAIVESKLRLSPYLFVGVDYGKQSFGPIRDTLHVADYLSFGPERRPSSVPEAVIAGIRQDEIEDYEMAVRRVRRKPPNLKEGDIVRIHGRGDSVDGQEGKIESARQTAAVVLINGWPWRIPYENLMLVSSAQPVETVAA